MSFFGKILNKLGIRDKAAAAPSASSPASSTASPAPSPSPAAPPAASTGVTSASAASSAAPTAPAPAAAVVNPIPVVDVVAQLEERARANPQKLNWRTSIVDLLKLLDLDSSLTARKELAKELYCPPELMEDSAKMNMWLHKNVLAHIAANGGNVPKELTD